MSVLFSCRNCCLSPPRVPLCTTWPCPFVCLTPLTISQTPVLLPLLQGPLPLGDDNGVVLLGERAAKCRAYAKALHYKELEFQKGPTPAILESLIR